MEKRDVPSDHLRQLNNQILVTIFFDLPEDISDFFKKEKLGIEEIKI